MPDLTPPVSPTYEVLRPFPVYVIEAPRKRYWINAVLLLATMFSTLLVGARMQYDFLHNLPMSAFTDTGGFWQTLLALFPINWVVTDPSRLLLGIPFSATLMLILLAHEMGHYLYCRHYHVYATLPYFIPAPTLIGTLGAFIRIKSPIHSRSALFDIGIAGPIAGFVVASITLLFSLTFSKPLTGLAAAGASQLGYPLVFHVAHWILAHLGISGAGILLEHSYLHPTAVAAWVGMFATALNLLPGGQLDGGHLVFAVFPRAHQWISRITVMLLLVASWYWIGWLLWAVMLRMSGMRHPQVPRETGLTPGRRWLFVLAMIMLALTFVVAPFNGGGFGEMLR
jgi:membrane-associated protease RseP (regulator of RpoE activity)